MSKAEIIFFWATVFTYVIAFVLNLFGFLTAKTKLAKYAFRLLWVGVAMHTATGIIRWITGSHPPVTNTYELNLTGTWFTVLILLFFEKLRKVDTTIALVVTPIVFLILGHGFISRVEAVPMGSPQASSCLQGAPRPSRRWSGARPPTECRSRSRGRTEKARERSQVDRTGSRNDLSTWRA